MIKSALISISATSAIALTGCASVWTSTDYTPYVGDETVYVGQGGAMEIMGGIEVWKQGLPNKPYKIIGIVKGEILDGWDAEEYMMEACALEAKDEGADAIISQALQRKAGTPYVNIQHNSTTINQTNTAKIYGNSGAVAVVQGNAVNPNVNFGNGFSAGLAQGMQGMGYVMAAGRLQGSYLAIKYVEVNQ